MGPIRLPSRRTFLISCLSSPVQNCHLPCKARTNCRVTSEVGGKKIKKKKKKEGKEEKYEEKGKKFFFFLSFPLVDMCTRTRYFFPFYKSGNLRFLRRFQIHPGSDLVNKNFSNYSFSFPSSPLRFFPSSFFFLFSI